MIDLIMILAGLAIIAATVGVTIGVCNFIWWLVTS